MIEMRIRILVAIALAIVLLAGIFAWRNHQTQVSCKKRGDAFEARVEALKRDAREKLRIGTKKDAVVHFFSDHGIPVTFSQGQAEGTIYTEGCSPFGCGTDQALLGLRIDVDEAGTVISTPNIGSMYTNCL
jgi:hypothetical protein